MAGLICGNGDDAAPALKELLVLELGGIGAVVLIAAAGGGMIATAGGGFFLAGIARVWSTANLMVANLCVGVANSGARTLCCKGCPASNPSNNCLCFKSAASCRALASAASLSLAASICTSFAASICF